MLIIEKSALDSLSALLLERAGLKIASDGQHSLRLALSTRMPALGISDAGEYVRRLQELAGEHELRSLLPLVTVGHTEFFRDARQFRALERTILPEAAKLARGEHRRIGMWSAGCATGEEPYSLAIVLDELGVSPEEVSFWGTDVNLAAIESARVGRFQARRFANMAPDRVRRHFRVSDEGYEVVPRLKEYVHFEGQNLASPVFAKLPPSSLDLILCRNVIIYFDLPTIRALMDRFHAALRPGGLLLLGYSESLFQVYDRFEMVEIDGAFVYRKPPTAPPQRPSSQSMPVFKPRPEAAAIPAERRPAEPRPPAKKAEEPKPPPPAPSIRTPTARLHDVAARMERGDFEGATAFCRKLADDEPGDLDALLTLGNLYSLTGNSAGAVEVFGQVLAREPLCVEARLFLAIASLKTSELERARAELGKALFLEPSLAILHYLLAEVQERLGDREGARRAYRNALSQLKFPQRPLAGHYPDLPDAPDAIARAARYALAALEDAG